MPRRARVVFPGYVYHVTQRGNNRQHLFHEDNDYILYLKRIEEYRREYGVGIYAYCLMGNHVHFIVCPKEHDSMAKMFKGVHVRYAQYFQKKVGSSGHVWQGRYYSCLLSGAHLKEAVRYVECNPVRANMVNKPWEYSWSSAREHLGKKYRWIGLEPLSDIVDIKNHKEYLLEEDEGSLVEDIRKTTKKNLVLGTQDFISQLEKKLGRKIMPKANGRPRKDK